VPGTSTYALTNATLPYAVELADKDWKAIYRENIAPGRGLNTIAANAPLRVWQKPLACPA
jgi:alanine dehydrogenase